MIAVTETHSMPRDKTGIFAAVLTGGHVISRSAFGALLLCMFVISASSIWHAVQWIDRPFPGFLLFEYGVVGSFASYDWAASQAGVRSRDVILEVNSEKALTGQDVDRLISHAKPGEIVRYTINRQGTVVKLSVPISIFSIKDLIAICVPVIIGGLLFWMIGIIVYFLKPDTAITWTFLLFSFCLGNYMMTGFELQAFSAHPLLIYYVNEISFLLSCAALLHLSFVFPDKIGIIRRFPWVAIGPYLASVVIAVAHFVAHYSMLSRTPATDVQSTYQNFLKVIDLARYYALFASISMVVTSSMSFVRSLSVLARQRSLVILFGSGIAFIPATVFLILMSLSQKVVVPQNLLAIPLLAFPAAIGYAIVRHNLFDVDLYIKRTVGYVLMTGIVAGGYFLFQTAFKTTILDPLMGASSEKLYPFLFALLTVFAFNPISQRVQHAVDKLFYRKQYDYKRTVAAVSESLTSVVDVKDFVEKVIHVARADLFVDRAGVILLDERGQSSQCTFRGGKFGHDSPVLEEENDPCFSPDDPLLVLLAKENKLITKYDVAEDPRYASLRESCGRRFEDLGASLTLPLYYRDQFAGALALGYKKSGHFYTREDIDLLKTLSTMTSTAIEQSREKGQKTVLMQLFSKHVSPQVAESLWEQRDHFLEGGRPKSQSMIVTAMFTDLQGFSTLSEKQTPEALMNWLNTYLEMMTNTVMEHGGVVDDFFGDGVKINFGVPIPRQTEEENKQDAVRAVNCAIAMERKMIALNEKMAAEGQQPLRMRVGIYTGPVVAGSLGSAERMKYTTIGDTVNTAARLESFDKDLMISRLSGKTCRILIGESTLRLVEGIFDIEKIGELSLKGKTQRIGAYCVFGPLEEFSTSNAFSHSRSEEVS
jgi:class 3 adenylate cyclase